MKRFVAQTFVTVLCVIGSGCCPRPERLGAEAEDTHQALATAQRELVVLPVFTNAPASGFPISSRNVICAAHALIGSAGIVAVEGRPMLALPPSEAYLRSHPWDRDWIIIHSTMDRFQANVIDCTIELHKGAEVFIGGYRGAKRPYDAAWHAGRTPEIISGRVFAPARSAHSPALVQIEVPCGDYCGFSGGPAAIIDRSGRIRVWGVVVNYAYIWEVFPPWRFRFVLLAARLPQDDLDRFQSARFLNPLESAPNNGEASKSDADLPPESDSRGETQQRR